MFYKGDILYFDWLEDGIVELVFDVSGLVNKFDIVIVVSFGYVLDVLEK